MTRGIRTDDVNWHAEGYNSRMVRITASPESTSPVLRLGFLTLNDAAPLVAAQERGFFARRGLKVRLSRETGLAAVREKIGNGELDAAPVPAPFLWAAHLGLGGDAFPVCTGLVLSLQGNAITLSAALWEAGVTDAESFRKEALRRQGERRLTLGIVDRYSTHHLLLREWLRTCGIEPETEVRMVAGPPAQMFRNLFAGTIDGYCVGEPWNSLAVQARAGWCPAWSASLSPGHVEKVLMVRTGFADARAAEHADLVGALAEAAAWCDEPENRPELASLLAEPAYLNLSEAAIAAALTGRFDAGYGRLQSVPDFHIFHREGAGCPTRARAAALQDELVAAGLIPRAVAEVELPGRLFREDIYQDATVEVGRQSLVMS
jgi:ABC-type nitrate/sulfonate/bicarbonate transport system substrate-binding protein